MHGEELVVAFEKVSLSLSRNLNFSPSLCHRLYILELARSSASIQNPPSTFDSSFSNLELRISNKFCFCIIFGSSGDWQFRFPQMNPHGALWPEHLGPRPDGIGYESASKAAGPPPTFPSSDNAPYAFRSGSPCGESYNFGDADGQFYYYGHQPCCDGEQSIDPWLLALMEDLRELYVRRRHTFQQLFPKLHGEIDRKLEEALRPKTTREVRAYQRSLSVGSPRLPGRDGGVGDEPPLRLDRFKVRTVALDDPVAESGGQQGGQSGKGGVASGSGLRNGGK